MASLSGGANITTLGQIADGLITNAKISASAAIAASKLSGLPTHTFQFVKSDNAADFTTTSTTFVDLTEATATFTPGSATNTVKMVFSGTFKQTGGAGEGSFTFDVDGTDDNIMVANSVVNINNPIHMTAFQSNLAASSHTIKVQVKTNTQTLNVLDSNGNNYVFGVEVFT